LGKTTITLKAASKGRNKKGRYGRGESNPTGEMAERGAPWRERSVTRGRCPERMRLTAQWKSG
jgi:hypothetical protein